MQKKLLQVIAGFSTTEQTLWAGRVGSGGIAQITPLKVVLILRGNTLTWEPPSRISVVSVNELSGQVVLACGNQLHYLLLTDKITPITNIECEFEIACIDVGCVGEHIVSVVVPVCFIKRLSAALCHSLP